MKKLLRILPLVIIVGLVVAIPASTQVFRRSATADAEGADLQLLVLVNRMELSTEQMQEIHDILAGLLDDREARDVRVAELEEQMIAFSGTAEELDGILETFRVESQEQLEGSQELMADAVDRIKEALSLKQGEILAQALPGLLGGASQRHAWQRRMLEQLEERLEERTEAMEGLRDRLGGLFGRSDRAEDEDTDGGASAACGRMGLQFEGGGQLGRGMMGRAGFLAPQSQTGCMALQGGSTRGLAGGRGTDVIEQLVEVLELKLEALE